jgi:AcrR family transcriptional regulator
MTTFTRQSIYTYYQTKDEVLLDLLKREILNWQNEMIQKFDATQKMTKKQFCSFLTDTLVARYKMLDLFSILYTILEKNCSAEKLAEFKPDAIKAFGVISTGVSKYFPHADIKQINSFTLAFFSYFLGLYPMAHITQKQIDALALAGIEHTAPDFRNMCYDGILHLLAWVD